METSHHILHQHQHHIIQKQHEYTEIHEDVVQKIDSPLDLSVKTLLPTIGPLLIFNYQNSGGGGDGDDDNDSSEVQSCDYHLIESSSQNNNDDHHELMDTSELITNPIESDIKCELKVVFRKEKTPTKQPIIIKHKQISVKSVRGGGGGGLKKPYEKLNGNSIKIGRERKQKAVRKLKFDEHKSSPVSGTIIRSINDVTAAVAAAAAAEAAKVAVVAATPGETSTTTDPTASSLPSTIIESGDIDPEYNIVEVTEEAKAEIAAIPNVIGSYACKLCHNEYEDAFGLARHRCMCIVLLEYLCPECGKQFNCPANLASHRRWHKAAKDKVAAAASRKIGNGVSGDVGGDDGEVGSVGVIGNGGARRNKIENDEKTYPCCECGKQFKRQAYLRKHLLTHKQTKKSNEQDVVNGVTISNNNNNATTTATLINTENIITATNTTTTTTTTQMIQTHTNENSHDSTGNSNNSRSSTIKCRSESEDFDSMSCSSFQQNFRLLDRGFSEEESIAATALAHLHNGSSFMRHGSFVSV